MTIHLVTRRALIPDHTATGDKARYARLKAGLTLRTMAKLLNVSAPFLSDLERGRRNWDQNRVDLWNKTILQFTTAHQQAQNKK